LDLCMVMCTMLVSISEFFSSFHYKILIKSARYSFVVYIRR